jgi:hypothetical protein
MNRQGVEIFSDKMALGIKQDFLKLIKQGNSSEEAVRQIISILKIVPERPEFFTSFWLAVAAVQWQTGTLTDEVKHIALMIIDEGYDLRHWDHDYTKMQQRQHVLEELRSQIDPGHKNTYTRSISEEKENPFKPGDALGYIMPSKAYLIFRVLKIHEDDSICAPICDICKWCGYEFPSNKEIIAFPHAMIPGTAIINRVRIKGHSLICIASHTQKSFPKYRAGIISRGLDFKPHSDIVYYTNWQHLDDCLNLLKLKPPRPPDKPWWQVF